MEQELEDLCKFIHSDDFKKIHPPIQEEILETARQLEVMIQECKKRKESCKDE